MESHSGSILHKDTEHQQMTVNLAYPLAHVQSAWQSPICFHFNFLFIIISIPTFLPKELKLTNKRQNFKNIIKTITVQMQPEKYFDLKYCSKLQWAPKRQRKWHMPNIQREGIPVGRCHKTKGLIPTLCRWASPAEGRDQLGVQGVYFLWRNHVSHMSCSQLKSCLA